MPEEKDLRVGRRIELHPATDQWMRGDRYGTIVEVRDGVCVLDMDRSGDRLVATVEHLLHVFD